MSCRICFARSDIPFNQKQRLWSSAELLISLNEGDIVYCHFPSKTIITQMKILSSKS